MSKCKTYINGHFFEYDCEEVQSGLSTQGIQYRVVTDLVAEPVDIAFLKQHVRVDFEMDDNLLESYLKSARQELEQYSQLSFGEKTIRLLALKLPDNYRLMYGPIDSIVDDEYELFGDIVKNAGGEEVTFQFTTGWEGGLPEPIKIAICQYAAGLYVHRENVLTAQGNWMDQAKITLDKYKNYFVV